MAVFTFPNHTVSTEYPDSAFRVQMGNSYQFSAPPTAPDQRKFVLKFPVMKWFVTAGVIDRTKNPEINLMLLDDFYNLHKTNLTFVYPHPVYGDLPCRFSRPLTIPDGVPQGDGAVLNVQVELLEQPGLSSSAVSELIQIVYEPF